MPEHFKPHEIDWTPSHVSNIWSHISTHSPPQVYFSFCHGKRIISRFSRYIRNHSKILDFGCGPGFLVGYLLDRQENWEVCGIDFSSESAQHTRNKYSRHPRFTGALAVKSLPADFPDTSFDAIFCIEVIEHLTQSQLHGLFNEAKRLLRPEGVFIITTPNQEPLDSHKTICPECGCIFHIWQHVRSFNAPTLVKLASDEGFEPVEVKPFIWGSILSKFSWKLHDVLSLVLHRPRQPKPHLYAVLRK